MDQKKNNNYITRLNRHSRELASAMSAIQMCLTFKTKEVQTQKDESDRIN